MKRLALIVSLGLSLFATGRGPLRSELAESERMVDMAIQRKWSDDPLVLIGGTRAFYVDGFGVVMTTELNLVTGPSVNPFNPTLSPEAKTKYRQRKLQRLPQMRDLMNTTLQQAKSWFPGLRDDEQIALGVQMYRYSWEDPTGLPSQVMWQTAKRKDAPIKMQDY
jgi:hypothetical protein